MDIALFYYHYIWVAVGASNAIFNTKLKNFWK